MKEILRAFSHITFVEQTHNYYSSNSRKYLFSTTRLLEKYMPKFREKYWLAHGACKRRFPEMELKSDVSPNVEPDYIRLDGKDFHYEHILRGLAAEVAQIKDEWTKEGQFGRNKGTYTHNHIDVLMRNKSISVSDYPVEMRPYILAAEQYYEEKRPIPVITEFVMGDDEYGIGGMGDCISDDYYLDDYKTDKTITKTNVFAKMVYPLNAYPASSLNKHFFQVNIYEWMVETHADIKINGKRIINFTALCSECGGHGNHTGRCADKACNNPILVPKYEIYDAPNLRADTLRLLYHYKEQKKK